MRMIHPIVLIFPSYIVEVRLICLRDRFTCDLPTAPHPAEAAAENNDQHDNEDDPSKGAHGTSLSCLTDVSQRPIGAM